MKASVIHILVFCLLAQLRLVSLHNDAYAKKNDKATVWLKLDSGGYARIIYNYRSGKVDYQNVSSKFKSAHKAFKSNRFKYIKLAFEDSNKIIFEYETKTKEIWYKYLPTKDSGFKIKIDNGFHIWPLTKTQYKQKSPSLSIVIKSWDNSDVCSSNGGKSTIDCTKLRKKLDDLLEKHNQGKILIKSRFGGYRRLHSDPDILLPENEYTKLNDSSLDYIPFTNGKKKIKFSLSRDVCGRKEFKASHLEDLKKLGVNTKRHTTKLQYFESYCNHSDSPAIIEDENMLVPITIYPDKDGGFRTSWNENMIVFIERLEMTEDFESGFESWQELFDQSIEKAKRDPHKQARFYIWHRRKEEYASYHGEDNSNLFEKQVINWPKRATLRSSPYKLKNKVRNLKNLHLVVLTDKPNREHSELLSYFNTKSSTVSFVYIGECDHRRAGRTKKYLKYYKKLKKRNKSNKERFYCFNPKEKFDFQSLELVLNGQNPITDLQ